MLDISMWRYDWQNELLLNSQLIIHVEMHARRTSALVFGNTCVRALTYMYRVYTHRLYCFQYAQ